MWKLRGSSEACDLIYVLTKCTCYLCGSHQKQIRKYDKYFSSYAKLKILKTQSLNIV